LKKARQS